MRHGDAVGHRIALGVKPPAIADRELRSTASAASPRPGRVRRARLVARALEARRAALEAPDLDPPGERLGWLARTELPSGIAQADPCQLPPVRDPLRWPRPTASIRRTSPTSWKITRSIASSTAPYSPRIRSTGELVAAIWIASFDHLVLLVTGPGMMARNLADQPARDPRRRTAGIARASCHRPAYASASRRRTGSSPASSYSSGSNVAPTSSGSRGARVSGVSLTRSAGSAAASRAQRAFRSRAPSPPASGCRSAGRTLAIARRAGRSCSLPRVRARTQSHRAESAGRASRSADGGARVAG